MAGDGAIEKEKRGTCERQGEDQVSPRPNLKRGAPKTVLISFKSGHYKKVTGWWKGDSVWCHFHKFGGGMLHVNKDEIEYMEDIIE